jgi:hypothetical protein
MLNSLRWISALAGAALVTSLVALGCGSSGSSGNAAANNTNPVVMSPPNGSQILDATIGSSYTQTFTVTSGGVAPYKFIANGMPVGLTFTQSNSFTATLAGIPTNGSATGTGNFAFQVIDADSQTTALSYVLTVLPSGTGALTFSPTTLPNAPLNNGYSQVITVSGGTTPISWSLTGTPPPGIALGTSTSATNTLTGTPTTAGTFSFTINATDSSSPAKIGQGAYQIVAQ